MNRDYVVVLRDENGEETAVPIEAKTPGLACRFAEAAVSGSRAVSVTQQLQVVGKCCRCNGFVFDGDNPRRQAVSRSAVPQDLRCTECA